MRLHTILCILYLLLQAIEFVVAENDDELFEDLITMALSDPGMESCYMVYCRQ